MSQEVLDTVPADHLEFASRSMLHDERLVAASELLAVVAFTDSVAVDFGEFFSAGN